MLVSVPARADKRAEREARTLFKEANRLAGEEKYDEAVEMFQSAYERFPNYKILVNLARVLEAIGRNIAAAEVYEKLIDHEGVGLKEATMFKEKLDEVDRRIGKLRVEVDQPGARLLVDGQEAGTSDEPLTMRVKPGGHAVVAEKDGYLPAAQTVSIEAGQEQTLSLKLQKFAAAPAPAPAAPPAEDAQSTEEPSPTTVEAQVVPARPGETLSHAGQLGLVLRSESDVKDFSAAPSAGVTLGLGDWVELSALALIQMRIGARVAATVHPLPHGAFKPLVRVGVPMFLEEGTDVGVHGGAGVVWDLSRRLGIGADIAVEYFADLGGEGSYTAALLGVGIQARID